MLRAWRSSYKYQFYSHWFEKFVLSQCSNTMNQTNTYFFLLCQSRLTVDLSIKTNKAVEDLPIKTAYQQQLKTRQSKLPVRSSWRFAKQDSLLKTIYILSFKMVGCTEREGGKCTNVCDLNYICIKPIWFWFKHISLINKHIYFLFIIQ